MGKLKCACGILLQKQEEIDAGMCSLCIEDREATPLPGDGDGKPTPEKAIRQPRVKKKAIMINFEPYPEVYDKLIEDAKKNFRNPSMQAVLVLAKMYEVKL